MEDMAATFGVRLGGVDRVALYGPTLGGHDKSARISCIALSLLRCGGWSR